MGIVLFDGGALEFGLGDLGCSRLVALSFGFLVGVAGCRAAGSEELKEVLSGRWQLKLGECCSDACSYHFAFIDCPHDIAKPG